MGHPEASSSLLQDTGKAMVGFDPDATSQQAAKAPDQDIGTQPYNIIVRISLLTFTVVVLCLCTNGSKRRPNFRRPIN